jgi:D-alanyl-D-alanine carboxypeptidase
MFRFMLRLVLLVGLTACGAHSDAGTLQSALDRQLALNAKRHGIAGQAVLILHNGKTVYRGSQGLARRETEQPVRPDDIFPVYSVSKLFASILVMQLVEQGQLDLNEPISRYVPDLPPSWRALKVNEIWNHMSGLPEYFDGSVRPIRLPATREAIFKELADKPFQFPTGTTTSYNQINFILVGALLEAHYRMPYRQIVTERIVGPLGLTSTYFGQGHVPRAKVVNSYIGKNNKLAVDDAIDWPEYAIVHAELYTTVDDLGRFLNAVSEGRLVKRATLRQLWQPYRYKQGGAGWFASGWDRGTSGRYRHVGHDGGTKVRVRLLFDDDLLAKSTYAFIYLTNGSAANVWSSTLIESLMAIVAPGELHD